MKNSFLVILVFLIVSLFPGSSFSQNDPEWKTLFNGKDLKEWKQLNGNAIFKAENGTITGISVINEPNSFLCTESVFGDFILEMEVMVDAPLNSGIQFRSNSLSGYMNGRVHGYQCEADPTFGGYSGGIYDEARRGWLYPLSRNMKATMAFKAGEWNFYRIEAAGNIIRTWINGIMCTNLVDDMTKSGFIGLQVHGIGTDGELAGKMARWRNIRIMTENVVPSLWKPDPEVPEISYLTNALTANEIKKGWKLLWDGKTTAGWRGAKLDRFPEGGWKLEDGILKVIESGGGESVNGGDIITIEQFRNFELELDFLLTPGANSGIKYFVDPELNKSEGSAIGFEYQLLDNAVHPDASQGVAGNRTLASLYDLIPAYNLSLDSPENPFNGIGKWNKARIVVTGNHVEHWLNNFKVVEFERGTQMYRALVAYSKYKVWPKFGESPEGHILLQDHGNEVHFKSIKIREL